MAKLTEEMKELVERQRLGFVATVCPDGTPNLSPKGTVSNLRTNPNVEVNVVDHFVRKGYRFKGTAQVLDSGPDFDRHVEFFSKRGVFDARGRIRAIVTVRVDQARPLISPGYDHVPDEATARAYWLKYYVSETGAV